MFGESSFQSALPQPRGHPLQGSQSVWSLSTSKKVEDDKNGPPGLKKLKQALRRSFRNLEALPAQLFKSILCSRDDTLVGLAWTALALNGTNGSCPRKLVLTRSKANRTTKHQNHTKEQHLEPRAAKSQFQMRKVSLEAASAPQYGHPVQD